MEDQGPTNAKAYKMGIGLGGEIARLALSEELPEERAIELADWAVLGAKVEIEGLYDEEEFLPQ